jgi:hypothetical protein
MSTTYFNMSELAAVAQAKDCAVHMHLDSLGKPVFSVGNSNVGAREFGCYFDALEFITDHTTFTAADIAEQAGAAIAHTALNAMLAVDTQAKHYAILKAAIRDITKLQHPDRAAGGFALALVNVIEVGLKNLPKGGEQ